jgi:hypothetical protein
MDAIDEMTFKDFISICCKRDSIAIGQIDAMNYKKGKFLLINFLKIRRKVVDGILDLEATLKLELS